MTNPPLLMLHGLETLSLAKLEVLRRVDTGALVASLGPGRSGSLKTRPDGMILDGHHRVHVLRERGVDVHALPREVIPQEVVPLVVTPCEVRTREVTARELAPRESLTGPGLPEEEEED